MSRKFHEEAFGLLNQRELVEVFGLDETSTNACSKVTQRPIEANGPMLDRRVLDAQ